MTLRFEKQTPADRHARGLAAEACATYHLAYAGELVFGHYFQIATGGRESWRWGLRLPVGPDSEGFAASREEAEAIITRAYGGMLQRAGLTEQRFRASAPR